MRRRAQMHDIQSSLLETDLRSEMAMESMRDPEHRAATGSERSLNMLEAGDAHRWFPAIRAIAFQHLEEGGDTLGPHVAQDGLRRYLGEPRPQRLPYQRRRRRRVLREIADRHRTEQPRQ